MFVPMMRRRTAIKTLGALGAAAGAPRLLAGCGDDDRPEVAPGIDHLVVVMMENRSYDHFLGARSLEEGLPGDGLPAGASNLDLAGREVEVYPAGEVCIADPPHGWNACRLQLGDGACDGFMTAYQNSWGEEMPPDAMSYLRRANVPVSYALADAFTSCDRWFSSVLGPTWPNRMYLHSGQSNGITANDLPVDGFEWPTIYHRLDAAGIDWRYYFIDVPVIAVVENVDLEGRIRRVMNDFVEEAAAGTLPAISVIDPAFSYNDDHPPHHPLHGQQFISLIYGALARSPQWQRSLLVITYDEHGGFYDHVAPPLVPDERAAEGFDQLGFRVPALIVGPYAKAGHVSSIQLEHTSVLAHIERSHGLEPLTARDAAANDLSGCIDQERLAAGDPLPPAEVPAVEIDESQIPARCTYGAWSSDVLQWADQARLPARWDLRASARDSIYQIGEVLDSWNLGRIRRGK
jgi:phospholipase C